MGLGGFEGSPGLWNLQGEGMFCFQSRAVEAWRE